MMLIHHKLTDAVFIAVISTTNFCLFILSIMLCSVMRNNYYNKIIFIVSVSVLLSHLIIVFLLMVILACRYIVSSCDPGLSLSYDYFHRCVHQGLSEVCASSRIQPPSYANLGEPTDVVSALRNYCLNCRHVYKSAPLC